jgi:hypothetical protein
MKHVESQHFAASLISTGRAFATCQLKAILSTRLTFTTSQHIRISCSLLITLILGLLFAHASIAQDDRVITMESGLKFEGSYFSTQQISETAAGFLPFEAENIIVIDDGLRWVHLSKRRILNVGDSDLIKESVFEFEGQKPVNAKNGYGGFISAGPFNEFGHRELKISVIQSKRVVPKTYIQGITKITPRYCELKSLVGDKQSPREWTMKISTRTVPKNVLRRMLLNQIANPKKPNEYFEVAYFFRQANDFDQARFELNQIQAQFPGQKERVADLQEELLQYEAKQVLQEVKYRIEAGQRALAKLFLKEKNTDGWAGEILAEVQDIEDRLATEDKQVEEMRQQISQLATSIRNVSVDETAAIKRFQDELESELNTFNLPRLAAYKVLANGQNVADSEKISLAISGWLLGSNNTESRLVVSESLFKVRDLVREYLQKSTTPLRRSQILNEFKGLEGANPKNIDSILKQMKPISPPAELVNYTGEKPLELMVEIPGTLAKKQPRQFKVLVHLPPEYNPYRQYPLILSLPDGKQPLEQNLNMWCGRYLPKLGVRQSYPMRFGYIIATVDYRRPGGQAAWGFTPREHLIVTKALKECLKSFSIDSDRVFLSGHGVGATGAYDIGSAHPEHWAGVIGYSGDFGRYTNIYKENQHVNLPFYCVNGSKHLNAIRDMKDAQNRWIKSNKYNDVIAVHYQGRANEYFTEDIPNAIEWMSVQRRRWPDRTGFEFNVSSLRPMDSYYWFFEMHSLPANRMTPPVFMDRQKLSKMTIEGKVNKNMFSLKPESYHDHDSTLWLSPDFVDFDDEIEIRNRSKFRGFVEPSIEVILEDVRRRADREHPFWARVDFTQKKWQVKKGQ